MLIIALLKTEMPKSKSFRKYVIDIKHLWEGKMLWASVFNKSSLVNYCLKHCWTNYLPPNVHAFSIEVPDIDFL